MSICRSAKIDGHLHVWAPPEETNEFPYAVSGERLWWLSGFSDYEPVEEFAQDHKGMLNIEMQSACRMDR